MNLCVLNFDAIGYIPSELTPQLAPVRLTNL